MIAPLSYLVFKNLTRSHKRFRFSEEEMEWRVSFCALAIRAAVGLWDYSGHASPPMYGDFEAQRHLMEITTALPVGDWLVAS